MSINAPYKISSPREYLTDHAWKEEEELLYYARRESFIQAVKYSTCGKMPYGTHSHFIGRAQSNDCWKPAGCANAARAIARRGHQIQAAKNFHGLWLQVQMALTSGPNQHMSAASAAKSVCVFDIALWIGSYLGLQPEYVYLHAGTLAGAERLLGRSLKGCSHLRMSELPEEWWSLRPYHAETALCAYKS
ncbi:hypothetical protein [Synechococcus sp. 1G10]|uniref:hypothetical protein n=1 Tax=Synechococcus sp. 1G10 TaxID=2025605 RepID=UPI000B983E76|nr:hypothetical protein [Synechococcus sp. 1G10]